MFKWLTIETEVAGRVAQARGMVDDMCMVADGGPATVNEMLMHIIIIEYYCDAPASLRRRIIINF